MAFFHDCLEYIIVFKDHVSEDEINKYAQEVTSTGMHLRFFIKVEIIIRLFRILCVETLGGEVGHRYDSLIKVGLAVHDHSDPLSDILKKFKGILCYNHRLLLAAAAIFPG